MLTHYAGVNWGRGRGARNAGKNGGTGLPPDPIFLPRSRFLSPSSFTSATQASRGRIRSTKRIFRHFENRHVVKERGVTRNTSLVMTQMVQWYSNNSSKNERRDIPLEVFPLNSTEKTAFSIQTESAQTPLIQHIPQSFSFASLLKRLGTSVYLTWRRTLCCFFAAEVVITLSISSVKVRRYLTFFQKAEQLNGLHASFILRVPS